MRVRPSSQLVYDLRCIVRCVTSDVVSRGCHMRAQLRKTTRTHTMTNGRATRFPLHLPLRYRSAGIVEWSHTATENMSRTGVLFRAKDVIAVGAPIEMQITLPVGFDGASVHCRGVATRTSRLAPEGSGWLVAATIARPRMVRDAAAGRTSP